MTWTPYVDPWPTSTPGGAQAPAWGGYVRLYVQAALAAGRTFHMGPHAQDRLDAGNVLAGTPELGRSTPAEQLWIDLACDVLDIDVQGGASSSAGVLTKPDAATCHVTIADPFRRYDPLNGDSPWALGGHSRLVPGTPIRVFAEVVDGETGAVSTHWIFTGTADSWGQDWTPRGQSRRTTMIATDDTKAFVNMHRPPLEPAVGAGETTAQRVERIADELPWLGPIDAGVSQVTFAATNLDGDGWTLLNRTLDDELGYVYFTTDGHLRWIGRQTWFQVEDPVLRLGCGAGMYDVLIDASPSAIDAQMRNAVYGARPDGAEQFVQSAASINRYGRFDYSRTDLGLQTDAQVGAWANTLLQLYAFPQISLADVTFRPDIDERSWEIWRAALDVRFVSDIVELVWAPPDIPDDHPIDAFSRVVGFQHSISRTSWEIKWQLVDARALAYSGAVFTMGPHANDRLDAGFVMG